MSTFYEYSSDVFYDYNSSICTKIQYDYNDGSVNNERNSKQIIMYLLEKNPDLIDDIIIDLIKKYPELFNDIIIEMRKMKIERLKK